MMNRRAFLGAAGCGVAGVAALAGYAHWVEPFWLDVTRRRLPITRLPQSLHGRTLLHVGDGRRVYISRGVGFNLQVRVNVRPEITLFTLHPA